MSSSGRELRDPDANTESTVGERENESPRRHSHQRGARYTFAHHRAGSLWIIHVFAPPLRRLDTCTVCIHEARPRVVVRVPSLSVPRGRSPPSRGAADNLNPFQRALSRAYLCGVPVCTWERNFRWNAGSTFVGRRGLPRSSARRYGHYTVFVAEGFERKPCLSP